MANTPDGVYDRTKPWRPPLKPDGVMPRWQYTGPFASNEERLTQQALMVATMPSDVIQKMVRPPMPQIQLFPDRFGYDNTVRGIRDIIDLDRHYMEPRVSWFSGGPAGYSGTSRNDLGGV
jgi:hypothetical protein